MDSAPNAWRRFCPRSRPRLRILYFGNNRLGWRAAAWLRAQGAEIAGVAVHPPSRARFAEEIIDAAGVDRACVFDGSTLRQPDVRSRLQALHAELGVSVSFGYLLPKTLLDAFPAGCINLHTGYLPYNRGAYPNVWSIVEGTPAGVTIHYLDEGVDTGEIVARREVAVEPVDTGRSLFERLEEAALCLFQETWPAIASGSAPRAAQNPSEGSTHRVADVARIDEIDLDRTYRAGELLDLLRARTFPPHAGAFFRVGGRRVFVSVDLRYDEPSDAVNEEPRA